VIKSRRMSLAEYVARKRNTSTAYVAVGKPEGWVYLGGVVITRGMILKWTLKKYGVKDVYRIKLAQDWDH
jgi:hypothetical protein